MLGAQDTFNVFANLVFGGCALGFEAGCYLRADGSRLPFWADANKELGILVVRRSLN